MPTKEEKSKESSIMQDDDFDVSTLPKIEKEESKEKPGEDTSKEDETKEESKKEVDVKSEDNKEDKESENKIPGDNKKEDEDEKKDELDSKEEKDKSADKEKDDEDDIFAEAETSEEKKEDIFDYKEILGELEIESDEEIKDQKSFIQATKKAINDAKEKLDLSEYNEDAQSLIKHLNEKKGDLVSFFENPVITQMNRMIMLNPEDRFREVRYAELYNKYNNEDDAIDALEKEIEGMSKGEIKTKAEEIAAQAGKLRQEEISNIIGQNQKNTEKQELLQQEKIKEEQQNIKNYIEKQNDFFGLSLTKNAKETIIKDIDNGKFDNIVSKAPQASKFFAYMVGKYGDKITDKYNKAIKEANRTGYNKMQDEAFNALHNKKPGSEKSAGHKEGSKGERNFDNLTSEIFSEK